MLALKASVARLYLRWIWFHWSCRARTATVSASWSSSQNPGWLLEIVAIFCQLRGMMRRSHYSPKSLFASIIKYDKGFDFLTTAHFINYSLQVLLWATAVRVLLILSRGHLKGTITRLGRHTLDFGMQNNLLWITGEWLHHWTSEIEWTEWAHMMSKHICAKFLHSTPLKTNMEPKNWWFVSYVCSFSKGVFSGSSR